MHSSDVGKTEFGMKFTMESRAKWWKTLDSVIFEVLPSPSLSVKLGIANVPDSGKQCINPDVYTETHIVSLGCN